MFNNRLLSLRGYDKNAIIKDAFVVEGNNLKAQILKTFENDDIHYIQIHNAKPGCYNCLVVRA